ncbi:MAG: NAD(P)/FAD-dependent oxidoreductase [Candidatus Latescibacterota bacterium]|nr:MAG: NAD(P)/FAD-dependent oxidoreductase [Candidatus Latescibacterota bacterium]
MPHDIIVRYAIVGAGTAGVTAAEAIREVDPAGELLIINGESYAPYCRPLIIEVLTGERRFDDVHLRGADWYDKRGISLINGDPAVHLDTSDKKVVLSSGRTVMWDKLLIAAGSKPAIPPIDGIDLEGLPAFTLYRQTDVEQLRPHARPGAKALLIGIGLIGLQAMNALREMGVDIVAIDLQSKVLPLILDAKAAKYAKKQIEDHGIEVRLRTGVRLIRRANGNGCPYAAMTRRGEEIPFDFTVLATGMKPDFSLINESAIDRKRGIKVNADMETSVPGVFAAGDVTEFYDVTERRSDVHGHWVNAYRQGRIAGLRMAGETATPYDPVYLNSLNIFGLPIITMGSSRVDRPKNAKVYLTDVPGRPAYTRFVLREGRLVAATFVNDVHRAGVFQYLMREKIDISDVASSLFNRELGGMEWLYKHHETAVRGKVEWPATMDLIDRYKKDHSHTRWGDGEKTGDKKP